MAANRQGLPFAPGGMSGGNDALQGAAFALNSGRPNDAERIAGDVLKANPRNALALHSLGSALLMQDLSPAPGERTDQRAIADMAAIRPR
jgi:hypothetical protein